MSADFTLLLKANIYPFKYAIIENMHGTYIYKENCKIKTDNSLQITISQIIISH